MVNWKILLPFLLLGNCDDPWLIELEPHRAQSFKINGVYIVEQVVANETFFTGVCFYQNGAFLEISSSRGLERIKSRLENRFYDSLVFPKYSWGRFITSKGKLLINGYAPGSPVGLFSVMELGEILSDSAFVITRIQASDQYKPRKVRRLYRFHDLPKPMVDSNNAYVLGLK